MTEADISGPVVRLECSQCGTLMDEFAEPVELSIVSGFFCDESCAADHVADNAESLVGRFLL